MHVLSSGPLPPGTGSVVLVVIGLTALYMAECMIWPNGRCTRCKGAGSTWALTSSTGATAGPARAAASVAGSGAA